MKKLIPNTNKLSGEPPKKNKLVNLLSNGITLPSPNKNDKNYEIKKGFSDIYNTIIPLVNPIGGKGLSTVTSGASKVLPKIDKILNFFKSSKPFKSEINWTKWNKEIPNNSELMKEYNAIEKTSKANKSWMKNPDGSAFKGTPEQFIQQQSVNFKKAFPNPVRTENGDIQINYHGSPFKVNEFKGDNMINGRIYGEGLYTTPTKSMAQSYAKGDNPQLYELYLNANNKRNASTYIQDGVNKAEKNLSLIEKKYGINSKEYKNGINEYNNTLEELRKYRTKIKENEDFMNIKDIQVTPFSNYPKSAIGNNGMFDMTNPNIYKALIPVVIGTAASNINKKDTKNKLK